LPAAVADGSRVAVVPMCCGAVPLPLWGISPVLRCFQPVAGMGPAGKTSPAAGLRGSLAYNIGDS